MHSACDRCNDGLDCRIGGDGAPVVFRTGSHAKSRADCWDYVLARDLGDSCGQSTEWGPGQ